MPAIERHKTETRDGAWTIDSVRAPAPDLAFAWTDGESRELAHHFVDGDDLGPASISACIQGIAALNGAVETAIPTDERRDAYDHLAAHLEDAGVAVPEFRSWTDELDTRSDGSRPRVFDLDEIEVREEDGRPKLSGLAVVYDTPTDLGPFVEVIERGAAKKSVDESDIVFLWNHNSDFPLGRTRSRDRTLEVHEDRRGVGFTNWPPNSPTVRDLFLDPIARGVVARMSFGFRSIKAREVWDVDEDNGKALRRVRELAIRDLSPVTFPAYRETSVDLRRRISDVETALGLDVASLVATLNRSQTGELTIEDRDVLVDWSKRLSGILTPPITPADLYDIRARRLAMAARTARLDSSSDI